MRTLYIAIFSISILLFFSDNGNAQNPTYSLDVNNLTNDNLIVNALEFDITMTWTNSGSVPNFEFAGGQYFFDVNSAISNGGVLNYAYAAYPDTISDLPKPMRPRNPQTFNNGNGTYQLRLAINVFPGAGNGFQMPTGVPVRIIRMRLSTSAERFAQVPLNLIWRSGLPNPFTKIFAYVGTTHTDISTPATHTISIQQGSAWNGTPFTADFSSNRNVVPFGGAVDFEYLGSGATFWIWDFSGIRSKMKLSNDRNPRGILYDSLLGSFSVTMTAYREGNLIVVSKSNYIAVVTGCVPTFQQTLKITDAGSGNDSIKFGMSPAGTNGLDTCLGEVLIPPPPPTGIFDCRFIMPTNDAVKTDFRKDTTLNTTWRMTFQPSVSGYPITFTWNNQTLPSTGTFFLKDEITGTLVNVNMRNQTSYTLTNSGITSLKIEYLYNQTLSGSVSPGWNIVSVPLRTSDMLYTALFPGVASEAYTYSGGYVSISMLSNGTGYWMRFNSNANYNFTGYPWSPENMPVSTGWNLIGPFDENIPVNSILSNPAGIVNSNYFGYSGGYFNPDTLKVGKGYWIRTTASGYLYKVSSDNIARSSSENPLDNFVRLELANAEEGSAVLYLAKPELLMEDYSMPPVPPAGIFDARFASDRYVEDISLSNTVMLSSPAGDTRISLRNAKGISLRIRDAVSGNILDKELSEDNYVVIPQNLVNFVIESRTAVPLTYELSQNYPNPFNPATTIKYQIPEDGIVRITVFDVLGKEVMVPLNSFRKAGSYELLLNASNLPSGVYFYRMDAGTFGEIRKMILLK